MITTGDKYVRVIITTSESERHPSRLNCVGQSSHTGSDRGNVESGFSKKCLLLLAVKCVIFSAFLLHAAPDLQIGVALPKSIGTKSGSEFGLDESKGSAA